MKYKVFWDSIMKKQLAQIQDITRLQQHRRENNDIFYTKMESNPSLYYILDSTYFKVDWRDQWALGGPGTRTEKTHIQSQGKSY